MFVHRNRLQGGSLIEPAYFALSAIDRELIFQSIDFIKSRFGGRRGVAGSEGKDDFKIRGHSSAAEANQGRFFSSFPGIGPLAIKHSPESGRQMSRMQKMATFHGSEQSLEVRGRKTAHLLGPTTINLIRIIRRRKTKRVRV